MNLIPESFRNLLQPETQAFAVLLTQANPESSLMTMMWFSVDGEHILFNSVSTSRKHKNIVANPKLHFMIFDPSNMYRYLECFGMVIAITREGAAEHNLQMANAKYGWNDGTLEHNRVMYRVELDKVRAIE